jgi:DNA-binding response OmpR family regulator
MHIAVFDTDRNQADTTCSTLAAAGYRCHYAKSVDAVLEALGQEGCRLFIIDLSSAGDRGMDLLHAIRGHAPAAPILLLAARAEEQALAAAMDAGASDYLVKPARRGELLMRVRILLVRAYPDMHAGEALQFGRYTFETASARIAVDGQPVDVTQKEFELALLFFRHLGRPLSRAYIRETVWSRDPELPSRTIDTHVSRVRNKLGLRLENGFRLSPVYSYGYQLEEVS